MTQFSGFDNIFETEAWCFWGNMKVLLWDLEWGLGTKGPQSDPADKTFLDFQKSDGREGSLVL